MGLHENSYSQRSRRGHMRGHVGSGQAEFPRVCLAPRLVLLPLLAWEKPNIQRIEEPWKDGGNAPNSAHLSRETSKGETREDPCPSGLCTNRGGQLRQETSYSLLKFLYSLGLHTSYLVPNFFITTIFSNVLVFFKGIKTEMLIHQLAVVWKNDPKHSPSEKLLVAHDTCLSSLGEASSRTKKYGDTC